MSDERTKTLPQGADGDNSIVIDNGVYAVDVGETESGTWIWQYDGHSTLFHEYFAMQDTNGTDTSVVESFQNPTLLRPFPDEGDPGNIYYATMEYEVGETTLRVKRSVLLDGGQIDEPEPILTVKYDIVNVGNADIDLDFFQYADFDDGSNDFWDDIGIYNEEKTIAYVRDGSGGAYAGLGTDTEPKNHHVGEYPGYDEIANDNLNNDDRFPATGTDDPVVAFEWDLGSLAPDEATNVSMQFGTAQTEADLESRTETVRPVYSRPPRPGVTASASVMSFVPGLSENETEGGNDLYSAFPNKGTDAIPDWPLAPAGGYVPVDDGFYGDDLGEAPTALATFLGKRKHAEGIDRPFRQYRTRHTIEVSSEPSGSTFNGEIDLTLYNGSPDGQKYSIYTGSSVTGADLTVTNAYQNTSYTVVEEDMVDDDSAENEIAKRVDSTNDRYRRAYLHKQYVNVRKTTIDGVEAIQVASLYGASNPYTREIINDGYGEAPIVDAFAQDNPIIFSWVELTILADGRHLVRIPDTSVFPKHVGYLDGFKQADSGLDVIFETDTDSGNGYDVSIDEDSNNVWENFLANADAEEVTPWEGPFFLYFFNYNRDGQQPTEPVMAYGRTSSGGILSRNEVLSLLPDEPFEPVP